MAVFRPTPGRATSLSEVLGHLSRVFVAKDFGESHDVLGLVAVEADRLNEGREALDAECGDLLGRVRNRKESGRRDVDALVGRLCGEHDGDEARRASSS